MSEGKPSIVGTAKKVFEDNAPTVRNIIATLFVFAFQALVTTADLFQCPTKGNAAYGWMFIFVPALALFLMSLLLSESCKNATQGCCYTLDPTKQIVRKYFPCRRPRWCCNEELLRVLFYSLMVGFLWIFWAFLQKDYYTCAVFGSEERLKNATRDNNTDLQTLYQKTQTDSQRFGFIILILILGVPFVFITIRRCCYLRPISSLPSLHQYEKLEAGAAGAKLKAKVEEYAKTQGETKAERYFAQTIKEEKDIADIIREAHADISSMEGYSKAVGSLDECKKSQVTAVGKMFKIEADKLAEERVTLTFKEKAWKEYEDDDPYDFVENVYEAISSEYPRVTGDKSQPYKKYRHIGKKADIEMEERHEEA